MKKIKKASLKTTRKIMFISSILSFSLNSIIPVYAENDPLAVINNLTNFIFAMTKGVGIIILVYGATQIGLSYQSHDPSQRTSGIFTIVGGIIITFAKELIERIT